ncbi:hypothetical protein bcere0013_7060 [Bacillus cereus BDRD-ST26]|nr:hypothetical protein bcere0013_7060 [Bacillus cereus BDRD-ST26]
MKYEFSGERFSMAILLGIFSKLVFCHNLVFSSSICSELKKKFSSASSGEVIFIVFSSVRQSKVI